MKKKLDDLCTKLPSPIPSPDINAPSPEPDNEYDLDNTMFDQVGCFFKIKYEIVLMCVKTILAIP